jgi:hypothetical protein
MIIGICGKKQHGKTTAANYLRDKHGFTIVSFADALRQMVEALDPYVETFDMWGHPQWESAVYMRYTEATKKYGYEEAKQFPDIRRLLQRMGTEAGRGVLGPNVWVDAWKRRVKELVRTGVNVVSADVRFPNEVDAILGWPNAGHLIRVVKIGAAVVPDEHASERYQESFKPRFVARAHDTAELEHEVAEIYGILSAGLARTATRFTAPSDLHAGEQ